MQDTVTVDGIEYQRMSDGTLVPREKGNVTITLTSRQLTAVYNLLYHTFGDDSSNTTFIHSDLYGTMSLSTVPYNRYEDVLDGIFEVLSDAGADRQDSWVVPLVPNPEAHAGTLY